MDSTLPIDRERGGKKQVGGNSTHQPYPFRTDDDARAGELPIPVGDPLSTYRNLVLRKPEGPSTRPLSNNPVTPRAGSALPVQQAETVGKNAAIKTDSRGDRETLLKLCLGQTRNGQEPDTTPRMTDAEADKAGLVRPE